MDLNQRLCVCSALCFHFTTATYMPLLDFVQADFRGRANPSDFLRWASSTPLRRIRDSFRLSRASDYVFLAIVAYSLCNNAVFSPFKRYSWHNVTSSLLGPANVGSSSTSTPITSPCFNAWYPRMDSNHRPTVYGGEQQTRTAISLGFILKYLTF